jgi:hypothetical protein
METPCKHIRMVGQHSGQSATIRYIPGNRKGTPCFILKWQVIEEDLKPKQKRVRIGCKSFSMDLNLADLTMGKLKLR